MWRATITFAAVLAATSEARAGDAAFGAIVRVASTEILPGPQLRVLGTFALWTGSDYGRGVEARALFTCPAGASDICREQWSKLAVGGCFGIGSEDAWPRLGDEPKPTEWWTARTPVSLPSHDAVCSRLAMASSLDRAASPTYAERPVYGLMTAGGAVLGPAYLFSALAASDGWGALFLIPIVGPAIAAERLEGDKRTVGWFLSISQASGALMLFSGAVARRRFIVVSPAITSTTTALTFGGSF
jgi:hypothetical protein